MKNFPSIKSNMDFKRVYGKGHSEAKKTMVAYVYENDLAYSRIGISASRKYGNSVERHLFIRRLREIFRHNLNVTKKGYDIVIVARNRAKYLTFSELNSDYVSLLQSHNIYSESK